MKKQRTQKEILLEILDSLKRIEESNKQPIPYVPALPQWPVYPNIGNQYPCMVCGMYDCRQMHVTCVTYL